MFLVFIGEQYYPKGGSNDLVGSFEDIEEAKIFLIGISQHYNQPWCHIYDTKTMRKVWEPVCCIHED